jgi:DNA-binding transcriptional LysR family regulator
MSIDKIDMTVLSLPGTPTLDQLRVLTVVAETGGFSAASRVLNRTQSVISYTVANLEAQLGVALFDRAHRRPVLTEAGRAILADARRIGHLVDELRARAAGLTGGLETEVTLVVDVMFPTAMLVAALEGFVAAFPTVALRLRVEALGGVLELVLNGICQLGISSWVVELSDAVERRPLMEIEMIAVAAPSHPLAQLAGSLPARVLHEHTQLVLTDRSRLTEGRDFGVHAGRSWRLGDLGSKHALLKAGLGWGNMPTHMVTEDLAAGRLVRLELQQSDSLRYPLYLFHRTDTPPRPAAAWLAQRLRELGPACPIV